MQPFPLELWRRFSRALHKRAIVRNAPVAEACCQREKIRSARNKSSAVRRKGFCPKCYSKFKDDAVPSNINSWLNDNCKKRKLLSRWIPQNIHLFLSNGIMGLFLLRFPSGTEYLSFNTSFPTLFLLKPSANLDHFRPIFKTNTLLFKHEMTDVMYFFKMCDIYLWFYNLKFHTSVIVHTELIL